jgi:antitoxin component YwqK of YwqJK toxin-antitoxin module
MKTLINVLAILFFLNGFAQEQKITYEKLDNDLIKATYYFADNDNIVEKVGFFNSEGKLEGQWVSYDSLGNTRIVASYKNGMKDGIWTYYKKDKINIVTYRMNKIINVEEMAIGS